jgi:hypothetical protein
MSLTLPPPKMLPSNTFAGVTEALWLSSPAPNPLKVKSLQVANTATVGGTLDVSGNTTVGGTLGVTGNITTSADIFATGNVSGANFASAGTITSGALATLAVLNVGANATVNGTLITTPQQDMGTLAVPRGVSSTATIQVVGNKIFLAVKAQGGNTNIILQSPFPNAIPIPTTYFQPIGQVVEFEAYDGGDFAIVVVGGPSPDTVWKGSVLWV